MTLDTSIEAAGTTVIEPEPIPSNKNTGEHEHSCRRSNGAPFHQFAAAIPRSHGLCGTDHGIRQGRLQTDPRRLSFSRSDRLNFFQDALHGYIDLLRYCLVQVTDAEKANIRDQAKIAGLTMSEYMRRIAFNKRIISKMDQKALGELARLGGLQKHLLKQIKGLPDEEGLRKGLNSTLSAVLNAVSRLNATVGK
jgi:hypothetical protein